MCLEYYLYCRKKYEDIINNINEIIYNYESLNEKNNMYSINQEQDQINIDENIFFYIERKNKVLELKERCEQKILELCKHDFVEDLVDIAPDRSKYITYCTICEYTVPK